MTEVGKAGKLVREHLFVEFRHTMDFVNKFAYLRKKRGITRPLHVSYSKLKIELWTHAINGLSENEFQH